MRAPFTVDFETKTYTSPPKIQYSTDTIIEPFRKIFGGNLPADKQIWSLCGLQNYNDQLLPGAELDRFLNSGFSPAEQYHGVDRLSNVIEANKRLPYKAVWHVGDFYQTMVEAKVVQKDFNPGIVHYDSINMPRKGTRYAASLIDFLSDYNDFFFVGNFVMNNWRDVSQDFSNEELIENLMKWPQITIALANGWTFLQYCEQSQQYLLDATPQVYTYTQRRDRVWMGSVILVRKTEGNIDDEKTPTTQLQDRT